MSFDPYGHNPDQPRPPADPTAPIDYPTPDAGQRSPNDAARDRVQLPGIFLVMIGVLNLVYGGIGGWYWYALSNMPPEVRTQVERDVQDRLKKDPKAAAEFEKLGWTVDTFIRIGQRGASFVGLAGIFAALLGIIGGIRMLQLKSYGLCVLAAIVSAIPCVSGPGCCCIGEAVGIWAIVVLLHSEVRSAFR